MSDPQMSAAAEGRGNEPPLEALRRLGPPADDASGWPEPEAVQALLGRVISRVARVQARCAAVDVFVAAQLDFSSTTDDVEAVYADLQQFSRWHRSQDPASESTAREVVQARAQVCTRLIESEALLATQVRQWLLFLQAQKGTDSALKLFLTQVAAWHAYVRRRLEEISADLERRLATAEAPQLPPRGQSPGDLQPLVDDFLAADELEQLAAWGALVASDRGRLIAFLTGPEGAPSGDGRRHRLVERLWPVADLLLIEDATTDRPLLPALAGASPAGRRWQALARLLEEAGDTAETQRLTEHFANGAGPVDPRLLEVVRRALLVSHRDPAVRRRAAELAPLDALWQVVVYPQAPLDGIFLIARQVEARGDDDLRKVFFDCIKSRLMSILGQAASEGDLEMPARFIGLFFGFGFFIQTRYFEQLETMLQLFRAQAGRFGLAMAGLDRDLHRLEVRRYRAGHPEATEPRALDRLPLPVQRHLAREGCYLDFFACHGNHLIAREVVPHVTSENLGRFLKLRDINRQLLEETMRRLDLGGKTDSILEVLTHPKCPMIFAGKHLPQLGRQTLHRVVRSRSTHSEVKRKAMLQMIKLQGGG